MSRHHLLVIIRYVNRACLNASFNATGRPVLCIPQLFFVLLAELWFNTRKLRFRVFNAGRIPWRRRDWWPASMSFYRRGLNPYSSRRSLHGRLAAKTLSPPPDDVFTQPLSKMPRFRLPRLHPPLPLRLAHRRRQSRRLLLLSFLSPRSSALTS